MSTTRSAPRRPPRTPARGSTPALFAARARAARWRTRRPLLVALALAVLAAALAGFVWAGPLLVVDTVAVRGVSGERAAQVRAAAQAPTGEPLARVDSAALAARVRTLPFVASVRVHRSWPTTLELLVDARTPAAAVPVAGGGYQLVDAGGVAYARAAKAPRGVPVVKVALSTAGRTTLVAALQVLAGLPDALRAKVSQVGATSPDAVTLRVGKATVVWGSADRTALKARIFTELSRTKATRAKVYDVSSPDTPVLR